MKPSLRPRALPDSAPLYFFGERRLVFVALVVALGMFGTACRKKAAAQPLPAPPAASTPAQPPETPPPSQPAAPVRRPSAPAPAAPAPGTPAAPPGQPLRLADMLTQEQQRQYNAAIDRSLARAQASLGSIANRQLRKEQQASVAQVQNFIQQAQVVRKSDLPAAKSLAERADVLARDLAKSVLR